MALSRSEGYRKGVGKEKYALELFEDFFSCKVASSLEFMTDKDTNWQYGDYLLENGSYLEVKGQPIDHRFYKYNYIELGEITGKELHKGGFDKLKNMLQTENLEEKTLHNKVNNTKEPIGHPEGLAFSLMSLSNGSYYCYANSNKQIIFIYSAELLLEGIKKSINSERPLLQGAGNVNEIGIGCLVDSAKAIWRKVEGSWVYEGTVEEEKVLKVLS
jgi:hypothetical protein